MNQYLLKKKYNISLNRYYTTNSNPNNIAELVGLPKDVFSQYINNQLVKDMEFSNYGKVWSIDHIVPVTLFNLKDKIELQICYHYTNLIPMLNEDNRLKGGSIHLSKLILQNRLNNLYKYNPLEEVTHITKLLDMCDKEIDNRWSKYLVK